MECKMQASEQIKAIRKHKNLSQSELAIICDVSTSAIGNIESGRQKEISRNIMKELVSSIGVNPSWLLTGEGEMFTDTKEVRHPIKTIVESIEGLLIPYLDQPVSAGFGQELLNEEDNDRYICIPDTGGKKDLKALTVKGDSMEPTLKNGDIVVCDTGGWDGDGVYVIKTHEFAFVKRVVLQTEGYQVISDNKMYPPYQVPVSEDTVIVGKVYCAVVKM